MTTTPLIDCQYSPEISSGNPMTPMPATDITITFRNTVLLQFPYDTPTTTLTLRNPDLNDTESFRSFRVQGYTRGDTLYQYRDPNWFKTRIYVWAFSALTRQNRLDILTFLQLSAGQYIKVTDYWSRVYKAIIMNPDNPITQELPDYAQVPSSTYPGMGYKWTLSLQRALI